MVQLIRDTKQYAKLLLSVGRQGRNQSKKHPLSPLECAESIKRIMEEEGETLTQISKRLDLGRPEDGASMYQKRDTTQVSLFLRLLDFSEKSRYFAGWGWEGYPKIPFSIMSVMSSLTPDEQDKIIQSAYNDDQKRILVKNDVHKILKWKNDNPDLPIDECIEKILRLKPITVTNHIIVCETHEKLKNFIKSHNDYRERILLILRENIDGEFYSIDATEILITISMDKTAYKTFHEKQYKQNISFTQFLNSFLEDKIG